MQFANFTLTSTFRNVLMKLNNSPDKIEIKLRSQCNGVKESFSVSYLNSNNLGQWTFDLPIFQTAIKPVFL